MPAPKSQPTVFTKEENDALSARSADYSAGLNGSGPVNKFHHAKGCDLAWTGSGLRDFFLYADPGIRAATGNRLDVHLVRANEAPDDYSPDMCFLEIAMAGTPDGMIPEEEVALFCETPAPTPWAKD